MFYSNLFNEKNQIISLIFKNCCYNRLRNKSMRLSITLYMKINKIRNSKTPCLLLMSLFVLCSNFYSYGQCPAGSAPTGTNLVVNGNFSAGNTGFSSSYYYCTLLIALTLRAVTQLALTQIHFMGNFQETIIQQVMVNL